MGVRENDLVGALSRVIPPGSVQLDLTDRRVDAIAVLPDGSRMPLEFKWAGTGFPRDIDRILRPARVEEPGSFAGGAEPIVFARSFTKNAVEMLRDRGVSWVGLDGATSLHLGTVWVERDARSETIPAGPAEFRWTEARLDIAEALLSSVVEEMVPVDERPGVPRVEQLAHASGRSLGAVAKALADFDREGWTARGGSARSRVLTNGAGLLDAWSAWRAGHQEPWAIYHSLHRDPARIVRTLLDVFGADVVFTGLTASQLVVPTTTSAPVVSAYVLTDREGWSAVDRRLEEHDVRTSGSGSIRLAPCPPVVSTFASDRTGLRSAPPVRVYADLVSGFSRELEAAEAFRTATLGTLA